MKRSTMGLLAVLLCGSVAGTSALAQPPHGMPGPDGHPPMMHGGMQDEYGHDAHHGGSWRSSLTSEQKSEISMSHLRMQQRQAMTEAKIGVKEAEIAALIASDEGNDDELQAGVDELVELKKELLLSKYQHLREVRQLLTPKQRISFDLWVLAGKFKDYHR